MSTGYTLITLTLTLAAFTAKRRRPHLMNCSFPYITYPPERHWQIKALFWSHDAALFVVKPKFQTPSKTCWKGFGNLMISAYPEGN